MKFYLAKNRHVEDDFEAVAVDNHGRVMTLIDGKDANSREWDLLRTYPTVGRALAAATNVREALNETL